MRVKRAQYISKNIEINQELHFAAAATKLQVNKIWNTHFSGSPLWNLFSPGAERFLGSYNKSMKYMMKLPLATHRFLLEPLSGDKPLMIILISRFLSFMNQIDRSEKTAIKMLKREALTDVRSTTGNNMRRIMLLMGENCIRNVSKNNIGKIIYYKVKKEDAWKIKIASEALDVRDGRGEIENFEKEEIEEMLQFACIS